MHKFIAWAAVMAAFLFGGCEAFAQARVYQLDLSFAKIQHNSDPMLVLPHKAWSDAVNIDIGVQAGRWYLHANPHFESAYSKVMTVGLLFHTGFELTRWLDVEWTHHSRHTADGANSYTDNPKPQSARYPLYDSFGLRVHFVPDSRRAR